MLASASAIHRRKPILSMRRRTVNAVMKVVLVTATALVLLLLALIVGYVVVRGAGAINLSFFTQLPKPVGQVGGGVANALAGTVELVALACCFGLPVGILGGTFIAEFGKNPVGSFIGFINDVLTGVPSIIVGIFAYIIVVLPLHRFSALSGGVALGILMVPIITRTTVEMLRLVPVELREASLALGVSERQTILRVVLPAATPGIVTGVMLAVARVAGETAPLLFTAFGNVNWQFRVDQPVAALPLQIFQYAISPYADWQQKAWAGSFLLILVVFVASLIARLATSRVGMASGRVR